MYVGYSLFLLHSDNISRTCYKNLYGRPCIQDFWASANLAPSQVSLTSFNGPKKRSETRNTGVELNHDKFINVFMKDHQLLVAHSF